MQDALLATMITDISARLAGELCGRLLLTQARTLQFNVRPGQRTFQLPAFPVTNGEAFTVVNDYERVFSGTAIAATEYYIQEDIGVLTFETGLEQGVGALRVTFTAGVGATASAVETAYPALADAVKRQVVYEFERKENLGQTTQILAQGATQRTWGSAGGWLPEVAEVIKKFKLTVFA